MKNLVLAATGITISIFTVTATAEDKVKKDSLAIETSQTKKELNQILTPATSGLSGFGSVVENFLPDFQLASLLAGNEDANPITMDFGYFLFTKRESANDENQSKFKVTINRGADLSEDLSNFFGDDFTTANEDQIDDLDDVELSFAYNFVSNKLGRSFKKNSDLFGQLHESVFNNSLSTKMGIDELNARKKLTDLTRKLPDSPLKQKIRALVTDNNCSSIAQLANPAYAQLGIGNLSPEDQNAIKNITGQCLVVEALHTERIAITKASLKAINTKRFSQLLANQPQLYVSASYRYRDELIGAEELSLKLTYEKSTGESINSILKSKQRSNFINQYLSTGLDAAKKPINDGKIKLSLEYTDVDDHKYDFSGANFLKKGGEKLTGTLGYGRSIMYDADDPVLRFDAEVDFIEHLGDTEGNDRAVATVTFTRKISDKISIPFSLQWANKGEFLSDDSSNLTANVGIKIDFERKDTK
jgi:hypothetical protein